MSRTAIVIDKLSKTFRTRKEKEVLALKAISLEIVSGEVFGFLGPNGAGKSTTIKILTGLLRASGGRAEIFGCDVGLVEARRSVGFLPENPAFYDFMTGREYLHYVGRAFGMEPKVLHSESCRVLELMELSAAADRPLRGYSKGMVQRLGLAQTLVHDPDLYILDEPMSGLDPLGRALVKEIILDLKKRGKTVFFSTHVTADVERVCDRVGVIVKGVFQEERVVSELLREGVDGYYCRINGVATETLQRYEVESCGAERCEVFVPRQHFDAFAADILANGGSFALIEPRRRDIEDYFLSLVRKVEATSCG